MSREGLASIARSIDEVKQVITTLTDDEWARPSGCTAGPFCLNRRHSGLAGPGSP